MFNKLIYGLSILLIGSTTFLFFQNKSLTEKTYEILAINNYRSLSYLQYLDKKEYVKLKESLIVDLRELIKNYDKNIDKIRNISDDNLDLNKTKLIMRDCESKGTGDNDNPHISPTLSQHKLQ